MQAAQRVFSLVGLAAGVLFSPAVGAIDRGDLLDQIKRMRPADLKILAVRPVAGGTYTLGMFEIAKDSSDPDLRRYKLWMEYPDDLVVPTESVSCSTMSPMRVTRDQQAIYLRRLNPGGRITKANRDDHLVWWAACVPDQAGIDPATLQDKARELGYPTLLVESTETLPLPPR